MSRIRAFNLLSGDARFVVKAATTGARKVYLYEEIGMFGVTAADFTAVLVDLADQDIDLHVNSPGGDVFDGLAILNTLRAHQGQVTVYVDGIAASAASFLIMGADRVIMQPNSELMIHDAWGMCMGNSADMRDMADRLDKVSDNIADVYARRTANITASDWRSRMRSETWLSADEAVQLGLADQVGTGAGADPQAVAFDLSLFKNKTTPKPSPVAPTAVESPSWPDLGALIRQAFDEEAA